MGPGTIGVGRLAVLLRLDKGVFFCETLKLLHVPRVPAGVILCKIIRRHPDKRIVQAFQQFSVAMRTPIGVYRRKIGEKTCRRARSLCKYQSEEKERSLLFIAPIATSVHSFIENSVIYCLNSFERSRNDVIHG